MERIFVRLDRVDIKPYSSPGKLHRLLKNPCYEKSWIRLITWTQMIYNAQEEYHLDFTNFLDCNLYTERTSKDQKHIFLTYEPGWLPFDLSLFTGGCVPGSEFHLDTMLEQCQRLREKYLLLHQGVDTQVWKALVYAQKPLTKSMAQINKSFSLSVANNVNDNLPVFMSRGYSTATASLFVHLGAEKCVEITAIESKEENRKSFYRPNFHVQPVFNHRLLRSNVSNFYVT